MVRGRAPQTKTRELVVTLVACAALVTVGLLTLFVVFLIRPKDGPERSRLDDVVHRGTIPPDPEAHRLLLEQLAAQPAPVEVGTKSVGDGWLAWAPGRDGCQLTAPSDPEGRAQLGLVIRAGTRPECGQPPPTTSLLGLGRTTPIQGWYLDPLYDHGDAVLRYWAGSAWTLDTLTVAGVN